MGVRVSTASLAAAVAKAGGVGTIASVGLGDPILSEEDYVRQSNEALASEIRRAKSMTNGPIAVNVMVALSNSDELVRTAIENGADMIVSGAGLPLNLPRLAAKHEVALAPIVSSGRAMRLICQAWQKRCGRLPDAVIVEGPLAGGHLGFSSAAHLTAPEFQLEGLVSEVLSVVAELPSSHRHAQIPVIAAGGIFTGADITRMLRIGAAGVQMASRFVCTEECDVAKEFKQAYLQATERDLIIFKTTAGMLARAVRTDFLTGVLEGKRHEVRCSYRCLKTCDGPSAPYCIAEALLSAQRGDLANGIVFAGGRVPEIETVSTVPSVISALHEEAGTGHGSP